MDTNDYYIINPAYRLKNDITNVILTNNKSSVFDTTYPSDDITTSFLWKVHPDLAYVFSFFNGKLKLSEICDYFSCNHSIPKEKFIQSISHYISNKDVVLSPIYGKYVQSIPKKFIIPNCDKMYREDLLDEKTLETIRANLEWKNVRLRIPDSMTLMLTTSCVTNCVYCYANRPTIKNRLPFKRMKEILKEASSIGMSSIDVDGGDFFLYEDWKELLQELKGYGYTPQISTKYPIDKEIIESLKEIGIKRIQLSIDSVINEEMVTMLRVNKDYLGKILQGLELLDKNGFEITIKPVITKFNDSEKSLNASIDYFSKFENVKRIMFTPADHSQFRPLSSYCSSQMQLAKLEKICSHRNADEKIRFLGYATDVPKKEKINSFVGRSRCTGNVSSFFVLPDGKVTLCEQMYWHPFFILGDFNTQSITEMWNSEKAMALWNFSRDEVREESPCKACDEFETCRRGLGNCWRMAIAAYGPENYDYPAPNCPKSLPVTRDFYIR